MITLTKDLFQVTGLELLKHFAGYILKTDRNSVSVLAPKTTI